jgi:hypothetical protein
MTNFNTPHGRKRWMLAAGHIPLQSTGREPAFTSHDKIAILNTSNSHARIMLNIIYENREPVFRYEFEVKARRVRKIRINDLIDPIPLPLDTPYGVTLDSSEKVIVQFSRMDTSGERAASFVTTPYYQKT